MKNALLTVILILFSIGIYAQFDQNIEHVKIYMKDGKVIRGIFKEMNSTEITYYLDGNTHTVKRSDVRKFSINDSLTGGESVDKARRDYSDQYLFFQSALPTTKGQLTYKNYNVFVNQFSYGFNEHFSLSSGFETVSFFVDEGFPVLFFTPKLSVGNDKLHYSLSTTMFVNGNDYAGIINANATYGDRKSNFTFGVSLPYNGDDIDNDLVYNINGMASAGDKLSFLLDAVIYNEFGFVIFGGGIRYIADNGIAVDAAVVGIEDLDRPLPVLGLSFPLSK